MNGRAIENGVGGPATCTSTSPCTFDASAGEAIALDSNIGDKSGNCMVSGNVVQGAGVGTQYQYGQVFEINGTHNVTVTGDTFAPVRRHAQSPDARHVRHRLGLLEQRRRRDQVPAGVTVTNIAEPVVAFNVYGGTFAGNTVTNQDSWNVAYISGCHNMDWRTTRWLGPSNVPTRRAPPGTTLGHGQADTRFSVKRQRGRGRGGISRLGPFFVRLWRVASPVLTALTTRRIYPKRTRAWLRRFVPLPSVTDWHVPGVGVQTGCAREAEPEAATLGERKPCA